MWRDMAYADRAAIFLRAADLLAGPWRDTLNGATMLGQSKTRYQAEIDAACELIDFLRFNVAFGAKLLAEQPLSAPGVWNQFDHRPLEGFVYAITPFNFTAIAGNLPTTPALLGNTVVWKPSPTQQFAAHHRCACSRPPACRPGVINMVTGDGIAVSDVALADPDLAGIHFTGSTRVFQHLWQTVGQNIASYRTYPRLVGETGGKDFVVAHPSADVDALLTALTRGAFDYQGQKCSAASRAYIPRSLWEGGLRDRLAATADGLTYGDVTDFSNFGGAVIDERAFAKHAAALDMIQATPTCARSSPAAPPTTGRATSCARRSSSAPTRPTRSSRPSSSARSSASTSTTTPTSKRRSARPSRSAVRADRLDLRDRPPGRRVGVDGAAVRGRQLLHQRQADRCRRRPAAVRRRARLRHQRQGRFVAEPGAVDVAAHDQGDVRAADRPHVPAHGLSRFDLVAAAGPVPHDVRERR